MQNNVEHVEDKPSESEGLIKTPRQLIVTILLAFAIPIIGILLLVKLVSVTSPMGAGTRAQSTDSIAERLQPVASFRLVEAATEEAGGEARTGQQVYELTCATCHAAGVADAPVFGNEAAWAPLIESGFDEMVRIAIEGVGAMPPRGGNPSLTDLEIGRAVAYMANNAGGSFDEPAENGATADASADETTAEAPAAQEQPQETATTEDSTPESAEAPATADDAAEVADASATDAEAATDTDAADTTEATDDAQEAAADTAAPDPAEVQQILTRNACLACHATENKMIGPAYRDVAEKYAGDASAAETIAQHVKAGSSGIWGPIPMPPNPGISDEDLNKVVTWILAGAPN